MTQLLKWLVDYLFDCHHKALSRVFTIRRRTYQVCYDCGAEFKYSLKTMSAVRVPLPRPVTQMPAYGPRSLECCDRAA